MPLRRIRITALRCLGEVELELDPRRNYVFGANGAGKTSLLEGIFVLGRGRSFRTRQIRRLVQRGSEGFAVFGTVARGEAGSQRLGVGYRAGKLEKKVDGNDAAGMASLAALLPVHAIDPSMHALVEGGPSERRRFLDWGVFHVEHTYLDIWKQYRRLLSQRNAALKRAVPREALQPWSAALLQAGKSVDESRRKYLQLLVPRVEEIGKRLLSRQLTLSYRRGWSDEGTFEAALSANELRDRETGSTAAGPHRAELVVLLDGQRVQDEASRGQQKLAAAALILAQVAVESALAPGCSVVVVDDPAAELDAASLARLLETLGELQAQLVVTALRPTDLPPTSGFPVFHVERGHVTAL